MAARQHAPAPAKHDQARIIAPADLGSEQTATQDLPTSTLNNAVARRASPSPDILALQRTLGNRGVQRFVSSLVQREPDIPGYGLSTNFGEYWIVPDDTQKCYDVIGEQITETEFADLQATWNAIDSGSGSLQISEKDDNGKSHGGFRDKILLQLGKLLSHPAGRKLVTGLVNGSQTVTILPTARRSIAAARRGAGAEENADGTAGAGSSTSIRIDADLKDTDAVAFDKDGKQIFSPVFIILGHELIHAQHNAAGRNRTSQPAVTNPAFDNREEEETIETGSLTENDLRSENNIPRRFGHRGRDTRPRR